MQFVAALAVAGAVPVAASIVLTVVACCGGQPPRGARAIATLLALGAAGAAVKVAVDGGRAYDALDDALDGPRDFVAVIDRCPPGTPDTAALKLAIQDYRIVSNPVPLQGWQVTLTTASTLAAPPATFALAVCTGWGSAGLVPVGIAAGAASALSVAAGRAQTVDAPSELDYLVSRAASGPVPYAPVGFEPAPFIAACPESERWLRPGALAHNWDALQQGLESAKTLGIVTATLALAAAFTIAMSPCLPARYQPVSTSGPV